MADDTMNDDPFERDVRGVLREMAPEQVPDSLRLSVAEVPRKGGRNMFANSFLGARSLASPAAAIAVLGVAVVALLASCSAGVGPTPAGPTPTATSAPPPTSSAAATPPNTPAPSTIASPTATLFAVGTPEPGDETTAASLASRYEIALAHSQWQAAWDLLSAEQQTHWTSYANFERERSAFFQSANGHFVAMAPTHDAASLGQWVRPDFPATANLDRAFLIEVDFPALSGNNAGWEILLVAPDTSGRWLIWQVR